MKFEKFGLSINSIKKILIVRFSSLGDVLLTTPIVKALKEKYPQAQIHFCLKKEFADVYNNNPHIAKIFLFEKDYSKKMKQELIKEDYDLVVDLQNNWRSKNLVRGLCDSILRFRKPTIKKLLLVHLKLNLLKEENKIVDRYAKTAQVLIREKSLELFLPEEIKSTLDKGKKYIGFAPGAKHFTKRWPAKYFIELGNELAKQGYIIVLFGGSSDKILCDEIAQSISGSINLQNDNNLYQLAADMKNCLMIVTNDSGLLHAATAVGVPVAALFGSTVKEFGFAPYGVKNLILENNLLTCRPCSHIGKSSCPKKHFNCMINLKPQIVLPNLQKFLAEI